MSETSLAVNLLRGTLGVSPAAVPGLVHHSLGRGKPLSTLDAQEDGDALLRGPGHLFVLSVVH